MSDPEGDNIMSKILNKENLDGSLFQGDCLEVLKTLQNNSIDQLVTDPPYGIDFMGKDWDKALPDIEIWKECYRVMKPGAFGFVCCIPRQDCLSRMIISLEDAGFNINFSSLYWTYATGFPKALNIGKAVDKLLKKKREVIGKKESRRCGFDDKFTYTDTERVDHNHITITVPASDEAKKLEGSYGGFQPKPAVEVIIVFMKPRSEKTYVDQALANGKGVVWLEDCRIPYKDEADECSIENKLKLSNKIGMQHQPGDGHIYEHNSNGRFPANLLVSDDVLDDVSRFFSLDAWAEKNVPFLIVPKASKKEKNMGLDKNEHPTVKPLTLMSYLITMGSRPGDVILDPFSGSFTTYCAAIMLDRKCIGIELEEEYIEIGKARIEYFTKIKKSKPMEI